MTRRHHMRLTLGVILVLALIASACGGGDDSGGSPTDDTADGETTSSSSTGGEAVASIDEVQPATVQIVAKGSFAEPAGSLTAYEEFAGAGSGSGFIIDPSGVVVTNNHVVTGAATLEAFVGGSDDPVNARVLGVSECADLAVIQLDGSGYPYFEWHEGEPTPGLEVRAAGFPLGDPEFTMTSGIVSKAEADGETNWASVDSVIEHDANIQPGNSGGPLVTLDGTVAGVNYSGGDPGTGTAQFFAISPTIAIPIIEQLQAGEDVLSLGVNGLAVFDEAEGIAGIWVSSVDTNSPAGELGLEGGDIIERIEGLPMASDGTLKDYCDILQSHDPADKLSVQVLRFETNEVLEGEFNGEALAASSNIFQAAEDAGVAQDVEGGGGSGGGGTYTEYTAVTDDTGTISMEVPVEWTELTGAPLVLDDGTEVGPQIIVSPDLQTYLESFAVPGIEFIATNDPTFTVPTMIDAIGPATQCTSQGREPYADGAFTGEIEFWVDCGGAGGAVVVTVAATLDADPSVLAALFGQVITEADFDAMDHVLNTFNVVG